MKIARLAAAAAFAGCAVEAAALPRNTLQLQSNFHEIAADPCFNPPTRQAALDCLRPDNPTAGIKAVSPGAAESTANRAPHERSGSGGHADFPILFPSGSAEIGGRSQQQLAKIAGVMTDPSLSGSHFRIEGHTDTVGTDAENQALSEARAHAVLDYLSEKLNVPRENLQAVGVGKSHLVVDTPDQTPEIRNRVVRIVRLPQG